MFPLCHFSISVGAGGGTADPKQPGVRQGRRQTRILPGFEESPIGVFHTGTSKIYPNWYDEGRRTVVQGVEIFRSQAMERRRPQGGRKIVFPAGQKARFQFQNTSRRYSNRIRPERRASGASAGFPRVRRSRLRDQTVRLPEDQDDG